MFFTREDILKIQKALTELSIKDSEMPEAYTPFNFDDTISVVQKGYNKKISVKEFIDQLHFLKKEDDIVNITDTYDESFITLEEAILLIPENKRKKGLVITFLDTNGDWLMYQFRGELNQWNIAETWKNLYDFTEYIVDSVLPDEEDLTKVPIDNRGNYVTKIKDKEYDPLNFSGMASKILRKHIIEVDDPELGKVKKNVLYQDDFDLENCVYEIKYAFDLNGLIITIPNNSTLYFNGGSFKNGTLVLQNTFLFGFLEFFKRDLTVLGTVKNTDILSEWWEMPEEDCYKLFKDIIGVSNSSEKPLKFNKREYRLLNDGSLVTVKLSIDFNGATLILNTNGREHFYILVSVEPEYDVSSVDFAEISTAINNKDYKANVFKKYKDSFMYVTSSEVELMRNHPLVKDPIRKKEVLYIDTNGYLTNTPYNDTISVEWGKYFKCSSSTYIKNLILKIEDTFTGSLTGGYRYIGLLVFRVPNLLILNIIMPNPNIENYRLTFFQIIKSYNTVIKDCNLTNTRDNLTPINNDLSAYVLSMGEIINLTFDNVLTGNLVSNSAWGATGSNYVTNWVINNSSLSRIDTHHRLNNLTVTNSVIGIRGVTYTGFGKIVLKECKVMGNYILYPRSDYGNYFDGDIIIEDCEVVNITKSDVIFVLYNSLVDFDFLCTNSHFKYVGCRNLIIKNLKLPKDKTYLLCPVRFAFATALTSPISNKKVHPNVSIDNISECVLCIDIWKYLHLVLDKNFPVKIDIRNSTFLPLDKAQGYNLYYQFGSDLWLEVLDYRSVASECSKYIMSFFNCKCLVIGDYHNNLEYSADNCHIIYSVGSLAYSGSPTYYLDTIGKANISNSTFCASPSIYKNSIPYPIHFNRVINDRFYTINNCLLTAEKTEDLSTIDHIINNMLKFTNKEVPRVAELRYANNFRVIKPLSDYLNVPEGTILYGDDFHYDPIREYVYISPTNLGDTYNVDLTSYLRYGICAFRINNKPNSTINITIPEDYYGYIKFTVLDSFSSKDGHIYIYRNNKLLTSTILGMKGDLALMPPYSTYLLFTNPPDSYAWVTMKLLMAATTLDRPSNPFYIGVSMFDTTLNKPVWWNGTNWIDATGLTV